MFIRSLTACKPDAIVAIICKRFRQETGTPHQYLEIIMDISELLAFVVKSKASDLHLSAGLPPMIRVSGDIRRINLPPLEQKDVHGMVYDVMNDSQRKYYEENLE